MRFQRNKVVEEMSRGKNSALGDGRVLVKGQQVVDERSNLKANISTKPYEEIWP